MTNTNTLKAAIIGGSGYGAGEMLRRLLIHPNVEVVRVASIDYVGEPVWAAHPNLTKLTDLVFEVPGHPCLFLGPMVTASPK